MSLGAQSFDARCLAALGRIHSPDDIDLAVRDLGQAGIENFNLDLMYGLPGQTVAQAGDDLRTALTLGPSHLSRYQLTLEPGTPFYRHPPDLPGEEAVAEMYGAGHALLGQAGLTATRCPRTRGLAGDGTTSPTGPSATTSAWAPAPTAS